MEPDFREIAQKWQKEWRKNKVYKTETNREKPKYYVLDMFPYPSGAGLHVGHPLGYIASDIVARFKRLEGYNVLHPMGFDAFGLPAEQYAIQTGKHPAETTAANIARYREQLDNIGFSYDWDREVVTADPKYYRWTQWIFLKLFNAWYNNISQKAEPIDTLVQHFSTAGSAGLSGAGAMHDQFNAVQWRAMSEKEKSDILMQYRLAYQDYATVNWCEALGTVLANDEVKDGFSERGGHPVEKRRMRQWFLRITAYADRLLNDLETLDWTDSMKEMQRNWIGRSEGAMVRFSLPGHAAQIEVFTTRPDTIFGVDFLTLAPEHELVLQITTDACKKEVEDYVNVAKNRSERERMAEVKRVSGVFTGAYALHPFTGKQIPVWVGDYVLAGYGTGAVMAVPAGDQRDWDFAKYFSIPVTPIHEGVDISKAADPTKEARMINSGFLDGLTGNAALQKAIDEIEKAGIGQGRVNYRLRDAGFSRQRYWGEPFPILYREGIPFALDEKELPLELPVMDDFKPTGQPEGPLVRAKKWVHTPAGDRETDTMPGYAGSSWYFLRYMDASNQDAFVSAEAEQYWQDVDLYIGGTEHAVGHLLYARFWQKFLYDLGYVSKKEPFKKLINQGMILGNSSKVYFRKGPSDHSSGLTPDALLNSRVTFGNKLYKFYISADIAKEKLKTDATYISAETENIPIEYVKNNHVDLIGLTAKEQRFTDCVFICKEGFFMNGKLLSYSLLNEKFRAHEMAKPGADDWIETGSETVTFIAESEVEKMSKSKFNVVNPDDIISEYGADTLRLYEMFLGPIDQPKPWNTNGIEGVYRFLNKLWRMFFDEQGNLKIQDTEPTEAELRILHKTIRKTKEDIERFSFNTAVSSFMICINELQEIKCTNKRILKELLVILSPFAPHITEELWQFVRSDQDEKFIVNEKFPQWKAEYIAESSVNYPVAFNGKVRYQITVPANMPQAEVQAAALAHEEASRWLSGAPKKVIVVQGRMVNVVV
jgi:leucyl-tRNA synthetase